MPSEEQSRDLPVEALDAMAPGLDAFRSGVATAAERLRGELTDQRDAGEDRVALVAEELGPFAEGRIDPERFAALFSHEEATDPNALQALEAAAAVLDEFAGAGIEPFRVMVPAGGDLRDTVRDALDNVGRVFGAARIAELARRKQYDASEHSAFLEDFPFRRWNSGERSMAPPLVISVDAPDLQASGLGEYLNGAIKLVIVVKGDSLPAPLAPLISPGIFVAQTTNGEVLQRLAASEYPGVALLFDDESSTEARFVHDPSAGTSTWQRLMVESIPEKPAVPARRPQRGADALAHLEALATAPPSPGDASGATPNGDGDAPAVEPAQATEATPAARLAAWLLQQSDLS